MLNNIGSNDIICSGVSCGSIGPVFSYIQLMAQIVTSNLISVSSLVPENNFPRCERNGVDQGAHNVLVHTNQIPCMIDSLISWRDNIFVI